MLGSRLHHNSIESSSTVAGEVVVHLDVAAPRQNIAHQSGANKNILESNIAAH